MYFLQLNIFLKSSCCFPDELADAAAEGAFAFLVLPIPARGRDAAVLGTNMPPALAGAFAFAGPVSSDKASTLPLNCTGSGWRSSRPASSKKKGEEITSLARCSRDTHENTHCDAVEFYGRLAKVLKDLDSLDGDNFLQCLLEEAFLRPWGQVPDTYGTCFCVVFTTEA